MAEFGNLIDEAQKEHNPLLPWLYWAINKRNKSLLFCFEVSEERGWADLLSRLVLVLTGAFRTQSRLEVGELVPSTLPGAVLQS